MPKVWQTLKFISSTEGLFDDFVLWGELCEFARCLK